MSLCYYNYRKREKHKTKGDKKMTKTTTYKKAYDKLVANNSSLVVRKDGTVKSFEEYEKFARERVERQARACRIW